jgi:DNA repair photolyase
LVDAGIDAGVLMAPLVPGFSTQPARLERTLEAIAASGARSVGAMLLHLEAGTRDHFMRFLERNYPALTDRYEHLYAAKYAPKEYVDRVHAVVGLMKARYGMTAGRRRGERAGGSNGKNREDADGRTDAPEPVTRTFVERQPAQGAFRWARRAGSPR